MITHVAIIYDGQIYALPKPSRHHHVIRAIGGIHGPHMEGFLDNIGYFLDRREAYKLAKECGQLIRPNDPKLYQGDELYSEDLW